MIKRKAQISLALNEIVNIQFALEAGIEVHKEYFNLRRRKNESAEIVAAALHEALVTFKAATSRAKRPKKGSPSKSRSRKSTPEHYFPKP